MTLWVTGATGFVGSAVVRAAESLRQPVVGLSRGRRAAQGQALHVDLFDDAAVRAAVERHRPTACVHCAWEATPGTYLGSPDNVRWLEATLHLVGALRDAGCARFVGVGTCFEYAMDDAPLAETAPLGPRHLYSATKAAAYLTLERMLAGGPMAFAWARLFYLYGPGEHPERFVSSMARALIRGADARASTGEQVRDFSHVDDVGRALLAVAGTRGEGAYNVGSGRPTTVAEIARVLGELTGAPQLVKLGAFEPRAGDPPFVCADVTRLRTETDWRPAFELREGLADTLRWWREAMR